MSVEEPNSSKDRLLLLEADKMFFDGDQKIKEGKITEALEVLFTLIEKYPEYGRAYNHIGFLYETRYRDYKTAEHYYKKALQYAPDYPATYLNYALTLSTLEKFKDLEELVAKGIQVPGVNKDKLYNEVGLMYEVHEKYDEAIEHFKKAIKCSLNEQDVEIYKKNIDRCRMKEEMLYFK